MRRLTLLKVTHATAADVLLVLQNALVGMKTDIARKRSIYHPHYDVAHRRARKFDDIKKSITTKEGMRLVGRQTVTEATIAMHHTVQPRYKPLPGKEEVLMTIGTKHPLHIYEGDTISVYRDLNKELVILIKQNTENKKKKTKSHYNTIIRK